MKAILACEKNGGIGFHGKMPWPKQSKDLQRFKELTHNTTIMMGRGTWESKDIPKPLPNRINVIVSSSDLILPDNCILITNPLHHNVEVDWVIGGGNLIKSVWNLIDEFHLSHLYKSYTCDTFINLAQLKKDFNLSRSQICMTHTYEIWSRKKK